MFPGTSLEPVSSNPGKCDYFLCSTAPSPGKMLQSRLERLGGNEVYIGGSPGEDSGSGLPGTTCVTPSKSQNLSGLFPLDQTLSKHHSAPVF